MSSRPVEVPEHPVVDLAHRLHSRLNALAQMPLTSMTPEQKRDALVSLTQDVAQLEALRLRVLAVAEKLERYEVLSAAVARGEVNLAQTRAIVAALERLPRTGEFAVTPEQRAAAETHLVGLAADHDAEELRVLGQHVFVVIAPELTEKLEGKALEAEEARALRRTTLVMWEDDEGTTHGRFRIPSLDGQMLAKMLLALTSPARNCGIDFNLPTPVRRGIAFTQLIESISAKELPRTGGCGATVVVTMTLEQLLADLEEAGVCTLDTGGRISASEARRLACTAGIIPMVLGDKSQVLDVGRKRRLHTEAMRVAMGVRDGGCTAEDCQTPPGPCHAHHDIPWVPRRAHQRGDRPAAVPPPPPPPPPPAGP